MDIEEYKKLARNKIEADALTQQVRDIIKITKWQKQDVREGFKETFKPLIKSQDSIKKSIDEQQNATIEQLKKNQLALTSGLEKINETNLRLAEMRELPALEGEYEEAAAAPSTSKAKLPTRYNIEKNFDKVDLEALEFLGYPRPNYFFGTDIDRLEKINDEVKNDVKMFTGEIAGLNRKKNKTKEDKEEIERIKMQKDLLFKYRNILKLYLATPANNANQTKTGHRFVADNTGEATPFDWYNARFSVDFKVQLLDGNDFNNNNAQSGIVNGSNSLIEKISILANGRDVYSCNYANHIVNIKNLLEYNPSYVKSVATNEFYYLDTSRNANTVRYTTRNVQHVRNAADNAEERANLVSGDNNNYNKGFAVRRALIGNSATISCEIPLNRYSFFESLEDKLLPNTKIELNIELESDNNLIWRTGGNACRVVLTRFQLFVPRLTFNSEGQKLYMENYLKPYKWVYLNEVVERSNNSQQQTGHFRITNAISKPRHVFVFGINTANIDSQTANPFLYNTFNLPNNANISRCYLEVGNGNEYPDIHFKPATDPARVFREVMSYVYANNDFQGGTLLTRTNFGSFFPFVYFDLTKQKMDIKDGVTKLSFHYELSANPNADYNIYALILHEREAEIEQQGGKLLLRA
ncbi:unnamed protein product [Porites evermanni]|uniref:Major capsid protein n=1 Tax=Porites evermanni TaxID=104178 RepID=A0ABN8SP44_9CNID|nr:unnamed protein product [Porites evermanni]